MNGAPTGNAIGGVPPGRRDVLPPRVSRRAEDTGARGASGDGSGGRASHLAPEPAEAHPGDPEEDWIGSAPRGEAPPPRDGTPRSVDMSSILQPVPSARSGPCLCLKAGAVGIQARYPGTATPPTKLEPTAPASGRTDPRTWPSIQGGSTPSVDLARVCQAFHAISVCRTASALRVRRPRSGVPATATEGVLRPW